MKHYLRNIRNFFFITVFIYPIAVIAQIEAGGKPRSLMLRSIPAETEIMDVVPPDHDLIAAEDYNDAMLEKGYRMGVVLPLDITVDKNGEWFPVPGGSIWKLHLRSAGARAMAIYYDRFSLPAGSDLYVYSPDGQMIAGAFTARTNTGGEYFATRLIKGDNIVLEYFEPDGCSARPDIRISGLLYAYRSAEVDGYKSGDDYGGSGSCEVNVNCTEGDSWKDQKQGVARILTRIGSSSFWCSGSLVNNTQQDYSPLLLTASHCALNDYNDNVASAADLLQWIFYFNYESSACPDPVSEPARQTMVGAVKLASSYNPSTGNLGSDFFLLKLKHDIPAGYNAFYNGWDRSDSPSTSGVCIHHPQGDIKKISTYSRTLISASWETVPGTHWETYWSETANGYGVTEGGSSGSPLINPTGQVIGTLTGGGSYCSSPELSDYFGKISYSWQSNGTADSNQLRPWLDPLQSGVTRLSGSYNSILPVARFSADTTTIPIGSSLLFYDLSINNPTTWHWYFDGGSPSESDQQFPPAIEYNVYGTYRVKLVVTNAHGLDSLVKENYLNVTALAFPNPTTGKLSILLGSGEHRGLKVTIMNSTGQRMREIDFGDTSNSSVTIDLGNLPASLYLITIRTDDAIQVQKVLKY